jgi:hypothetical protein
MQEEKNSNQVDESDVSEMSVDLVDATLSLRVRVTGLEFVLLDEW